MHLLVYMASVVQMGMVLVTTRREGKTRVQDISTFTEIKATETNTVPDFLVTGIVTDEQGQPKAGVSIVVPNTTIGAITDANGRFRLKTRRIVICGSHLLDIKR